MYKLLTVLKRLLAAAVVLLLVNCNGSPSGVTQTQGISISAIPNIVLSNSASVVISSTVAPPPSGTVVNLTTTITSFATVSPSSVTLTPENPKATVIVSGKTSSGAQTIALKATTNLPNTLTTYSNNFSILPASLPDGGTVNQVTINYSNNSVFAASSAGNVWVSTQSSPLWVQVGESNPIGGNSINVISVNSISNSIFAQTNLGFSFVSYINAPWIGPNGGGALPNGGIAYDSAVDANGNLFVADSNGNLWYITSAAAIAGTGTWALVGGGSMPDGGSLYSIAIMPTVSGTETLYAGSHNGHVYASSFSTSGASTPWMQFGGSMPDNGNLTAIALDTTSNPQSGNLYAATSYGAVYFVAGSSTMPNWSLLTGSPATESSISITQLATDSLSNVYALTNGSYVTQSGNVLLQAQATTGSNTFSNWTLLVNSSLNIPDGCYMVSIATNYLPENNLVIGTGCGDVYYSNSAKSYSVWTQLGK